MADQEKKDAPLEEQFVKFPMLAFWQLRDLSESELKVLLYIQRHTAGFSVARRILSVDEIMNGRKLKGGGRMDQGTGLSNRAVIDAARKLERRRLLFPADEVHGQKSYATVDCPPLTELMKKVHRPKVKQGRVPVKKVHKAYEDSSQALMKNVHNPYEDSSQGTADEARRGAGRRDPIDTLTEQFIDTSIDTLAPLALPKAGAPTSRPVDIKIEEEKKTKETAPSPSEPPDAIIATSAQAEDVGAGAATAEAEEAEKRRKEEAEEQRMKREQAEREYQAALARSLRETSRQEYERGLAASEKELEHAKQQGKGQREIDAWQEQVGYYQRLLKGLEAEG